MVKMVDAAVDKNQQRLLEKKLEKCRNPENNPDSDMYGRHIINETMFTFPFF